MNGIAFKESEDNTPTQVSEVHVELPFIRFGQFTFSSLQVMGSVIPPKALRW